MQETNKSEHCPFSPTVVTLGRFRSYGKVPKVSGRLRLKLSVFQRCKEIQKDVQIQDPNLSEFI